MICIYNECSICMYTYMLDGGDTPWGWGKLISGPLEEQSALFPLSHLSSPHSILTTISNTTLRISQILILQMPLASSILSGLTVFLCKITIAFSCQCWHMLLIPALRRQRQADLWVQGQPGLLNKFQDRKVYTEKPYSKQQQHTHTHTHTPNHIHTNPHTQIACSLKGRVAWAD